MHSPVSIEEQEQILQTIEMFEVIAQANPEDCQSLEILKEAYWKLGRQGEALAITRKLADTYSGMGQYSSALLEYEGILQKEPNAPGVAELLRDVEQKLHQSGGANGPGTDGACGPVSGASEHRLGLRPDLTGRGILITTGATRRGESAAKKEIARVLDNDGNEPLAKFLVQHRLVSEEVVQAAMEFVQKTNKNINGQTLACSLIDEIARSHSISLDGLLCGILERSKFAFVPLDYYDVDRQIVKMLPETLTLGRLIVPFDMISRTVMVAMANPFDVMGKEAVQQLFDYNIQWHLAAPWAICKVLRDTYRLDARD